ncbi:283_t:CDS:2, partial [Acaulospora morrowiae]
MVTFTTDYWAPALDSKARRRIPETAGTKPIPIRNNSLPVVDGTDPKQTPFSPKHLTSSSSTPASSSSNVSSKGLLKDLDNSSKPAAEPKKITIVKSIKNLLNAEHKISENSPPSTPVVEESELEFNNSPKISMLKEILNPKLDLHEQFKGIELYVDSESYKVDPECMLFKKYGVCEKGCIGKGATAIVRLVHKNDQTDTEATYAVKKLTSEFCISSSLQHVNVVKTVDLVQDENHNWCEIMEYCVGGDLYAAIKSGFMTSVEINCCFKQLIMGVGYLHSTGVAHRDIKPENLLLSEKGHLKITDFGVSDVFKTCWEGVVHMSKGLCGSEPYIAPEQFETKEYDARLVDVWACGIVYYCMIYQGIPFRMATPNDPNYANYLETRNIGLYESFEKLPRGCRDLMYKILEPNPQKRYTIEQIKNDSWFQTIECCTETENLPHKHNHVPPEYLKEIQANNASEK